MHKYDVRLWQGKAVIQWDDESEEMFITRMTGDYRPLIPPIRIHASRAVRDS
jgi:hypothetical protein